MKTILGWAMTITGAAIGIGIRFKYPDSTETRLLIDHWPVFLLVIALVISGSMMVGGRK